MDIFDTILKTSAPDKLPISHFILIISLYYFTILIYNLLLLLSLVNYILIKIYNYLLKTAKARNPKFTTENLVHNL